MSIPSFFGICRWRVAAAAGRHGSVVTARQGPGSPPPTRCPASCRPSCPSPASRRSAARSRPSPSRSGVTPGTCLRSVGEPDKSGGDPPENRRTVPQVAGIRRRSAGRRRMNTGISKANAPSRGGSRRRSADIRRRSAGDTESSKLSHARSCAHVKRCTVTWAQRNGYAQGAADS